MQNYNSKQIGNLTELQCAARLYEIGCSVSLPFGDSDKYDLIIDYKDNLYKVQCKHANPQFDSDGQLAFLKVKTTWQSRNSKGYIQFKYEQNEIDFFATMYNGECYLIPISECSLEKRLRLTTPKNGQVQGICFLKDYLAKEVLDSLELEKALTM